MWRQQLTWQKEQRFVKRSWVLFGFRKSAEFVKFCLKNIKLRLSITHIAPNRVTSRWVLLARFATVYFKNRPEACNVPARKRQQQVPWNQPREVPAEFSVSRAGDKWCSTTAAPPKASTWKKSAESECVRLGFFCARERLSESRLQ